MLRHEMLRVVGCQLVAEDAEGKVGEDKGGDTEECGEDLDGVVSISLGQERGGNCDLPSPSMRSAQ